MNFTFSVEGVYCLQLPSVWQLLKDDPKKFALQNNISDEMFTSNLCLSDMWQIKA
jgi:hypothetical protein